MTTPISELEKILLIDACDDVAGVALCAGESVCAKEDLPRAGSAEIISAVSRILEHAGLKLNELDAIGVVNGPGSFTGVRVGLAAAKGLCEASSVRMIAVSRLQVLADAVQASEELLALDAGRGEFYLCERTSDGSLAEWLGTIEDVLNIADGRRVFVTEAKTVERLAKVQPLIYSLHVEDALGPVLRLYRKQTKDMTLMDANYLRREEDIYKKQVAICASPASA